MTNRYLDVMGAIALAAAIAGVFVGRMLVSHAPPPPALASGTAYPSPRALADFALVDTLGAPADARRRCAAIRRWCSSASRIVPDVCPTTLAMLAIAQKQAWR